MKEIKFSTTENYVNRKKIVIKKLTKNFKFIFPIPLNDEAVADKFKATGHKAVSLNE